MTDSELCLKHYGHPESKEFQKEWLVRHELPTEVLSIFPKYGKIRPKAIYMNKFAVEALDAVLLDLLENDLFKELKTYDGCHNIRQKRGIDAFSIHSWGLAIDFNAMLNPLGVKWRSRKGMFSKEFIAVWEKHKWICGARWKRSDAQHFQFTGSYPSK